MFWRPPIVTLAASLCVVFGGLGAVFALFVMTGNGDLPVWMDEEKTEALQMGMLALAADALLVATCGFFMFQGANWARWTFVIEGVLEIALVAFLFPQGLAGMASTFIFRVVCTILLFLPASNDFFGSSRRNRGR